MLDSIYIGMSGLVGYSKGLRVISNNLTNLNTPGFKGSQLQFADLFYQENTSGNGTGDGSSAQFGTGLNTLSTAISFKPGESQQTGNKLDMAINGQGFFILNSQGETSYTRDGQFRFDSEGFLISQIDNSRVQGLKEDGSLADISLGDLKINAPKATSTISFNGNLSSDATTFALNGVNVIDAAGGSHSLTLTFTNAGAGKWTVDVTDGTAAVGSGTLTFSDGTIVPSDSKISLTYSPAGVSAMPIVLDFSQDTTSFSAGSAANSSTLAMHSHDGFAEGSLTDVTFDADGKLVASYSNGQTEKGMQLALADFASDFDLKSAGNNTFVSIDERSAHLGHANSQSFGSIASGSIEGSNIDMAEEFSQLIIMQRGYQSSSHVISTANDMIQELFDMKGNR